MYISLNKKLYNYDFNQFQSIFSIKQDIINTIYKKNTLDYTSDELILIFNNHVLEDKYTPHHYKIKKNDTILLSLKNKGGRNLKQNITITLSVLFIVFILIPIIIGGIIPFFSFLVSRIFIKGFDYLLEFIYPLIDKNNWISSFVSFLRKTFIPLLGFLINYIGLILVTFAIIFFSTINFYSAVHDDDFCLGFQASKYLAIVTTALIVVFYIIGNLPTILKNISNAFLPLFVGKSFDPIIQTLSSIKLTILQSVPFIGGIIVMIINLFTMIFKALNQAKFYAPKVLYEWENMYKYSKQPDIEFFLQEEGLNRIRNGLQAAHIYENGKTIGETPFSHLQFSSFIGVRFIAHTLIYLLIQFIDIFDVCGTKSERLIQVQKQLRDAQEILDDLETEINDPETIPKEKQNMRNAFRKMQVSLGELQLKKEKEESQKKLDVPCMKDILVSGAVAGLPTLFVFILLFILFSFKKTLKLVINVMNK
jgi:hypothetical protein